MRIKADSEQIRRLNRRLVLDTLRSQGKLARVELGRATGLSPATITSISGDLIDEQIVRVSEEDTAESGRNGPGRPLVRLELNADVATVLAIKISIDEIDFAMADFSGNIINRAVVHVPTFDIEAGGFGKRIATEASEYLSRVGIDRNRLSHIGVAVQGFADMNRGSIVWSPAFKARDIPVAAPLVDAFGVGCTVTNDANMIAQFLLSTDLLRFGGTAAVIYVGPGIGMGLIIGGSIYAGSSGSAAEFGHMNHVPHGPICRCGQRGCIEAYAANYGIYRSATGDDSEDAPHTAVPDSAMKALEERARLGDPRAASAFHEAGLALGFGISRVIALLSPEKIFLVGPGTRAFSLMEAAVHEGIRDGLVADLRQSFDFEVTPWNRDMIVAGILSGALRHLDREVFSRPGKGPLLEAAE